MKIIYAGHSGFVLEEETYALMIDCCGLKNDDPLVQKLAKKRLYVLASHAHGDHFDPVIMTYNASPCIWVLSKDIRKKISVSKYENLNFIKKGETYSDEFIKVKAYGSTDEGVSFYIGASCRKIFHAGDLNNWHWNEEETPADAEKNEKFYLDELGRIAGEVPELDAAFFPVDPRLGKDYARGAEQFLEKIKVGLFVPMHFWDNYEAARKFKKAVTGSRYAEINKKGDEFIL